MKTKFGCPPVNGKIYCKVCNCFLCDEDYSVLEGFDDNNKPMSSKDIINNDDNNSKEKILEKIEKNEILLTL